MSKAVLMSIKPKWCELIASGKKTVEVRKTKPKFDTPFRVYIYCTKDKWQHLVQMPDKSYRIYNGKEYGKYDKSLIFGGEANGKVIGEFVCDRIDEIRVVDTDLMRYATANDKADMFISEKTCLDVDDLFDYLWTKRGYGWHISDLVIYDKPKDLSEFSNKSSRLEFSNTEDGFPLKLSGMKRPPQSWCYVEELSV